LSYQQKDSPLREGEYCGQNGPLWALGQKVVDFCEWVTHGCNRKKAHTDASLGDGCRPDMKRP